MDFHSKVKSHTITKELEDNASYEFNIHFLKEN